jgi:hypothetical protein
VEVGEDVVEEHVVEEHVVEEHVVEDHVAVINKYNFMKKQLANEIKVSDT